MDKALKNAREIPLEDYLEEHKVKQINLANQKRKKLEEEKERQRLKNMKPDKKSFNANSRYEKSGWSSMRYEDKVRMRREQYRNVGKLKHLDNHSVRKFHLM